MQKLCPWEVVQSDEDPTHRPKIIVRDQKQYAISTHLDKQFRCTKKKNHELEKSQCNYTIPTNLCQESDKQIEILNKQIAYNSSQISFTNIQIKQELTRKKKKIKEEKNELRKPLKLKSVKCKQGIKISPKNNIKIFVPQFPQNRIVYFKTTFSNKSLKNKWFNHEEKCQFDITRDTVSKTPNQKQPFFNMKKLPLKSSSVAKLISWMQQKQKYENRRNNNRGNE